MEGKRIFSNKKTILLFLLLFFATIGLYVYFQFQSTANTSYRFQDKLTYQREWKQKLAGMSFEEAEQLLLEEQASISERQVENMDADTYDWRLDCENAVVTEELDFVTYLQQYPDYLANILEDKNALSSISIFKKSDSFASANLDKTKEDYGKLKGTTVSYGQYAGLTTVMDYDLVHYSLLIFAFILVWAFFEDEKKGLKCIAYAAPEGRGRLALHRIEVLAGGTVTFTILVYASLFLCSFAIYGGVGDLGNSIQSVEMFQTFTFPMTILQYMVYYVVLHSIITLVMSLFIWMVLLLCRNRLLSTAILIVVVAGETILSLSLKEQCAIPVLKYANLYYMINPVEMLSTYRNYKLFGQVVNSFHVFVFMVIALFVACSGVCIWISAKRKTVSSASSLEIVLMRFTKTISNWYHKMLAGLSVFGLELYKILVMQKGFLYIAIWAFLLFAAVDTTEIMTSGGSAAMHELYDKYSGPDDGRLRTEYLAEQEKVLADIDAEYEAACIAYENGEISDEQMYAAESKYSGSALLRSTVNSVQSQLAYMERVKAETGIPVWFMYQKGYKIMMTGDGLYEGEGYGNQETYALYAIVLLVLLLSMVFSYDRSCGMEKLLYATPNGRNKLFHIKIGVAAILCLIICVVTYGLELYEIQHTYPLDCLGAPVQSLTFMEKFPLTINIGVFLVLLEVIHFVALFGICMVIYCLSAYLQDLKGLLANLLVLVVPSVMYLLGLDWCGYFAATQPVIYVEALQEHGFTYSVIMIIVTLVISILCYRLVKKRWCNKTSTGRLK